MKFSTCRKRDFLQKPLPTKLSTLQSDILHRETTHILHLGVVLGIIRLVELCEPSPVPMMLINCIGRYYCATTHGLPVQIDTLRSLVLPQHSILQRFQMFLIVNYCFEHHFWLVSFFGTNEIGCVYDENTFAQICKSFKYIFVEHLEKLALYVMKVKIWHW